MRRLRTQLLAAFVVLSVVPLTAIVAFGYFTSERTFRHAVEQETSSLATQMDHRVDAIAAEVRRDIHSVGSLPVDVLLADFDQGKVPERVRVALGENAELLTMNIVPDLEPPDAPGVPAAKGQIDGVVPEGSAAPPSPAASAAEPVEGVAAVQPSMPAPAVPPVPHVPIVIDEEKIAITVAAAHSEEARQLAMHARERAYEQLRARVAVRHGSVEGAETEALTNFDDEELATSIVQDGETIGKLRAQLRGDELVRRVIRGFASQEGDVVFAVDEKGSVFAASDDEKETIESEGLDSVARGKRQAATGWVVASSPDTEAGVSFAIARPISGSLREMRAAAARNFAFGIGLIGFALIGIVPLTNHIARDIETVTDAAEKIALGELDTEVRVGSRNEIGKLAAAFNGMARDLRQNQQRLLEEERTRRDHEIEGRLLAAQYERKSAELEDARKFQLSLLPSTPPAHPTLEVASFVHTATEVGGDYWDYLLSPDGTLTLVVGDATGHGARAGTMVTVVKSLFATFSTDDPLADFLERANQAIRKMGLERMAMALTIARFRPGIVEIAAAGMPPVLIHRAVAGTIEDVLIEAPPLGTLPYAYGAREVSLGSGDAVLLMTDGYPELLDADGEPLGYVAVEREFAAASHETPRGILDHLSASAEAWTGGEPPADDITFVAVKVR